jgi:tetratricopeptide (TPR) repeat protein
LVILALLFAPILALAQDVPIPGMKTVDLHVKVFLDDDRAAPRYLRVTLLSDTGSSIIEGFTDEYGEVIFKVVGRRYQIRVTGQNIEETTSNIFQVDPRDYVQYENITVRRVSSEKPVDVTPSTVSAARENIPGKAAEQFDKGNSALKAGHLQEARQHFEDAVKTYPKYSGALNNLGIIAAHSGDLGSAQAYFQKAVAADPGFVPPMVNLSKLFLRLRDFKQAQELLGRASALEPQDPQILVLLAETQLLNGDLDHAITNAQRVPEVAHPGQFSIAHVIAGTALRQKNMNKEAVVEFQKFLTESPSHPAAGRVRATIRALGGVPEKR